MGKREPMRSSLGPVSGLHFLGCLPQPRLGHQLLVLGVHKNRERQNLADAFGHVARWDISIEMAILMNNVVSPPDWSAYLGKVVTVQGPEPQR